MDDIKIEILRGKKVESVHIVDAAVVDAFGKRIDFFGDANTSVYPRSSIKPLQALPFVLSGAHSQISEPEKAIALSCASHSAQSFHLDFLKKWHREIGLQESDLVCGPQPPDDDETNQNLILEHKKPSRIHNNCSGKHTAMLATCLARGWPIRNYEKWSHPLQAEIRRYLSLFSKIDHETLSWGIDGCGIPNYYLPLENVAIMMSAFLNADSYDSQIAEALNLIRNACKSEPWMLSGTKGLCSQILDLTKGQIFVKVGAEGNYTGLFYKTRFSIALKARDGSYRGCEAALYALIERYANLDTTTLAEIKTLAMPTLFNWAGTEIGEIRVSLGH